MYFLRAFVALAGLTSMASAIPAPAPAPAPLPLEATPTRLDKRSIVIPIPQTIQETNIIVIEQNLGAIEQLAQIAEQEFAARLQAELALITQLQTIKNNIRVNHFRNMFSTINVVIVTVTNVVDVRDASNPNTRYYVNQLLADNGAPQSQIVVMLTASETMTIGAQQTDSAEINQVLQQINGGNIGAPTLRNYDASFPFGRLNESVLLPYGTQPPSNALVFSDPANIIFAGQTGLFVENQQTLVQDCALFGTLGNSFLSPVISIFPTFEQLAAQQALGLILGSAVPPALLFPTASSASSATATSRATNSQMGTTTAAAAATMTAGNKNSTSN